MDVKKIMAVSAAMIGATAMAVVESANVVG